MPDRAGAGSTARLMGFRIPRQKPTGLGSDAGRGCGARSPAWISTGPATMNLELSDDERGRIASAAEPQEIGAKVSDQTDTFKVKAQALKLMVKTLTRDAALNAP